MPQYKSLTPEEQRHFLEHGWIRVPNAIKSEYLKLWMDNLWVRLGWDEHDKSTWKEEYVKLPRHREVRAEEFAPEAWAKMCELVGGEERVDPERERYYGDQLICNFGKEENIGQTHSYDKLEAWHTDNDWWVELVKQCLPQVPPVPRLERQRTYHNLLLYRRPSPRRWHGNLRRWLER